MRSHRPTVAVAARSIAVAVFAAALLGCRTMGGPAQTGPPPPSGAIAVEAKEYSFTPSAITVPAGTVNFTIRNAGNEAHEFKILEGETTAGRIESIGAGATEGLTVTLAGGSYELICTLNGHDQLGMKGTLTVTGG